MSRLLAALVFSVLFFVSSSVAIAADLSGASGVDQVISPIVAEDAIVIDGKLDDTAWQQAAKVTGFFQIKSTQLADQQTSAWFVHSNTHLIIAAKLHDSDIRAKADRARDKQTWEDDCFEIFIDPNRTRSDAFQFIVTAEGRIFDARAGELKWNADPDLQVASARTADGWQVEVAIPFAALGLKQPIKGEVWDLKLAREDYTQKSSIPVLSSWQFVSANFHDAGAYGRLVFEDTDYAINGDLSGGIMDGRWAAGMWRTSTQSHAGGIEIAEAAGPDRTDCLKVNIDRYTQVQTCVRVNPMRNYRVTAWVNMDGADLKVRGEMYQEKNTKVGIKNSVEGWQKVETLVPIGETEYIVMTFTFHGGNGSILIDNLKIEQIDNVPRKPEDICYTGNATGELARHNQQVDGRYTYYELGTRAAFFPQPEERGNGDVELHAGWIPFTEGKLTDGKPTYTMFHHWTPAVGKTLLIDLGKDCFVSDITLEPTLRKLHRVKVRFKPANAAHFKLVAISEKRGGTLSLGELDSHTRWIAIDYTGEAGMREVYVWGRPNDTFVEPKAYTSVALKSESVGKGGSALVDVPFEIFPTPQHATYHDDVFQPGDRLDVALPTNADDVLKQAADQFAQRVLTQIGLNVQIVSEHESAAMKLFIDSVEGGDEGYELNVTTSGINIAANKNDGLYNALLSLSQCATMIDGKPAFRCVAVRDWPRYPLRIMQVWSRQMQIEETRSAVQAIAGFKMNELMLMGDSPIARQLSKQLQSLGMDTMPRCADMPASGWFRDIIEMNPGEKVSDLPSLQRVNPCPSHPKLPGLLDQQLEIAAAYPGDYIYINCDEMYQEAKGARWNVCDYCTARNMTGGDLFAELINEIYRRAAAIGKKPVMLDTMLYVPWKMEGAFAKIPRDIPVGIWHPLVQGDLDELGFPVFEFLDGDQWTIDATKPHTVGAKLPGDGGLKLEKAAIWAQTLWQGDYPDLEDPVVLRRISDAMVRIHEAKIGAPLPSLSAAANEIQSVDLSDSANVVLTDKEAGDGVGVFDLGVGTDMSFMQGSHQLSGASFNIGKSIVAVESRNALDPAIAQQVKINVDRQAASLLFLHGLTVPQHWTYAWQSSDSGDYLIEYADGSHLSFPILYKDNILELSPAMFSGGYKSSIVTLPAATPAYKGTLPNGNEVLLLRAEWVNPYPNKKIKSVTLRNGARQHGTRICLFAMSAVNVTAADISRWKDTATPTFDPDPTAAAREQLSSAKAIDLSGGSFDSDTKYTAPDKTTIEVNDIYTLKGATLIHRMKAGYVTIDNNLGWQVVESGPRTMTITFPAARKVTGLQLRGMPESPEYVFINRLGEMGYTIEVSPDGSTWKQVATRNDYNPLREASPTHLIDEDSIKALRIHIQNPGTGGSTVRGISYLQLFGE